MENIARKLQLIIKSLIFVTLATFAFNASAGYVYVGPKCGKRYVVTHRWVKVDRCGCPHWKKVRHVHAVYRGPYRCCYYYGPCCRTLTKVPCHWDTYGNYVPGYWTTY